MRKVLVAAVISCLTLGLTAGAMAAVDISTSGAIEFTLSGTSEEGKASGLFGAGDVLIDYHVTLTSGPWTAVVSPEFDIGGGALAECDAYITYSAEAFTLTLDPTGIDNGIFDIYSVVADDAPNIASNPGLKLEVPFGSSFYLVMNNQQSSTDSENAVFNFGGGLSTSLGGVSLDLAFNSDGDEGNIWYGTSYGLKVGYALDAISLVGEYGAWSPGADGLEAGSGYYFEFGYTLPGGDSLTLSYTGSDKNLNGAGNGPTDHEYSKIKGSYSHSLAEAVTLGFEVASTDSGLSGAESITTWKGKISIAI